MPVVSQVEAAGQLPPLQKEGRGDLALVANFGSANPPQSPFCKGGGGLSCTRRGFTLVELLVALAIFSVMSVVAYRGLNAVLETREHLMDDNRKWRELAVFFSQMKESVINAVDRPVRDSGDLQAPAFLGKPDAVGEHDAQLIFTRMGLPGQQGHQGDLQRFGYRLRDRNIELLVWPALDQAPHTLPAVSLALGHVSSFVVRYLDDKGVWQAKWPLIGQHDALPRAVEVRLGLESGEQVTRVFAP